MQFIDLKAQQTLIRKEIENNIIKVLDHGQYIMGPEIKEIESVLANFIGSKHCISNASGTDALLLALLACGIGPGDEVITTPFTFFATAEMISLAGAKIVLVDIDPKTYNIDPELIEAKITDKTKAIIPVSLYGQCANYDRINEIAGKHNIAVFEDGAQSFGSEHNGKKSCSMTTIGCTSFFPSKPLGCYGDGGACFTDDDELAQIMRELRVHGQHSRYNHTRVGFNARMDTVQAAVLMAKMKIFPNEIEARQRIGARYTELLKDVATTPFIAEGNTHIYGQYTIQVPNRKEFQAKMKEMGVPTAVHYPIPLHEQPVYKNELSGSFPHSEDISKRVVSLPMHPYLDEQTQDKVVEAVKNCL